MRLLQAFFDAKVPQLLFDGLLFALVLPMSIQFGRRYGPWIALGRERRAISPILLIPALCAAFNTFFDLLEALIGPPIRTTPLWLTLVFGLLLLALLWWGPTHRYIVFFTLTFLLVGIAVLSWLSFMTVQALVRYGGSYIVLALVCIAGTLFLIGLGARLIRSLLAPAQEGGAPLSDGSAPPARETGDTESGPEPPPA